MKNYRIKNKKQRENTLERQRILLELTVLHVYIYTYVQFFFFFLFSRFPRFLSLSLFLSLTFPRFLVSLLPSLTYARYELNSPSSFFFLSFLFSLPSFFFPRESPGCTPSRFCFQNPMADDDEIEQRSEQEASVSLLYTSAYLVCADEWMYFRGW